MHLYLIWHQIRVYLGVRNKVALKMMFHSSNTGLQIQIDLK